MGVGWSQIYFVLCFAKRVMRGTWSMMFMKFIRYALCNVKNQKWKKECEFEREKES